MDEIRMVASPLNKGVVGRAFVGCPLRGRGRENTERTAQRILWREDSAVQDNKKTIA